MQHKTHYENAAEPNGTLAMTLQHGPKHQPLQSKLWIITLMAPVLGSAAVVKASLALSSA